MENSKMEVEQCWYKKVCQNECSKSCMRYNIMRSLCEKAMLPTHLWNPSDLYPQNNQDYDSFQELLRWKRDVLSHVQDGDSLYLYSSHCGNGKTMWASKILMKYFDLVWHHAGFECKALFLYVPTLLIQSKMHFGSDNQFDELLEQIRTVPLVVWDDIMFENLTEYEKTWLLGLLDHRFNSGLSNIFTSNIGGEDMRDETSQRIYSRIWNYSTHIKLVGEDMRGAKI